MKYQIPVAGFVMLLLIVSNNIPSTSAQASRLGTFIRKYAKPAKELVDEFAPKIAENWNQDSTTLNYKVICNHISEAVKLYNQNRNRFSKQQIIAIYNKLVPGYKYCVAKGYIIRH